MDIFTLRSLRSRAATAENPQALAGAGGATGGGRKGQPCIWPVQAGQTVTLLDVDGPGLIRHIWCTVQPGPAQRLRNCILRMYWDDQEHPSVEVPLGDFFGVAHGAQTPLLTDLISMQEGKGFNSWIPMPFAKHARITVENDSDEEIPMLFYQIDFTSGDEIDESSGYFHAQFRRANPCPLHQDYTILDDIDGQGVYLGTILGVRCIQKNGWWGEGEVKFYIDDDLKKPNALPTICGTGAEDYMGSAWGLNRVVTPTQGAALCDKEQGYYSLYRLHHRDPIYFQKGIKVTIQQIGFGDQTQVRDMWGDDFRAYTPAGAQANPDFRYYERSDDWCSVAYWYQSLPSKPFPTLPNREQRCADLPQYDGPARDDV